MTGHLVAIKTTILEHCPIFRGSTDRRTRRRDGPLDHFHRFRNLIRRFIPSFVKGWETFSTVTSFLNPHQVDNDHSIIDKFNLRSVALQLNTSQNPLTIPELRGHLLGQAIPILI